MLGKAESITQSSSINIFIVDDSKIVRERLMAMLVDLTGVRIVGHASDARDAIERIQELSPDVVILDIRLRTGSGIFVLQELKQSAPSPIVIMLTNYPEANYRKKCAELGADFFFDKSTEFDRVVDMLTEAAEARRRM